MRQMKKKSGYRSMRKGDPVQRTSEQGSAEVVDKADFMAVWAGLVSAWKADHGQGRHDVPKSNSEQSSTDVQYKPAEEVMKADLAKFEETWKPRSAGLCGQGAGVDSSSSAAHIADEALAGLDFSFDEKDNNAVEQNSVKKRTGISFDGMTTDIWMADSAPELLFATRLLLPGASENLLPKRGLTAGDGVLILFCPKELAHSSRPSVMDLCSGEIRPCRKKSFEEEIYSKDRGLRAVIVPSERLKGRCVLLSQISAQEIQAYRKEPSLDAALSRWGGCLGRHVFFWSPLTSQAGVLSENEWWDWRVSEGRFHQVLCNLNMLKDSGHDVGTPAEGAIKNFNRHIAEKFYRASWTHVCGTVEKQESIVQGLLSALDEGPRGMLRSYRVPLPPNPNEGECGLDADHSAISVALLRVYLENVECAVSAFAGKPRIVRSNEGSVFNALYASALKHLVNCGDAGLDALGRCVVCRMAMSVAADLVRKIAQDVASVGVEVAGGKSPTADFYRKITNAVSLENVAIRSHETIIGRTERVNSLVASFERELRKAVDGDGTDYGNDGDLSKMLLLLHSREIASSLRMHGEFGRKLGKLVENAVRKPGDVSLSVNERKLLAALETERDRLVVEIGRLREWLESDKTLPRSMSRCFLELLVVAPCEVDEMVSLIRNSEVKREKQ